MIYKTDTKRKAKRNDFHKFKLIRSFWRENHNGVIIPNDALEEQIHLKSKLDNFSEYPNPKSETKKKKDINFWGS